MKIIFTGGGSGGHIFPIIAICQKLKTISTTEKDYDFFYIGPKEKKFSAILKKEGIKEKNIQAGKIRRYFSIQSLFLNVFDILFRIPIGIIQSFVYIFLIAPDVIFSKGGYGSFPVIITSWLLGAPIIIHESDVIPGTTNQYFGKLAIEIFVSFSSEKTKNFPPEKIISIGNPIRTEILKGSKETAKNLFKLTTEKPIILILGGSQGAQRINDLILQTLPEILKDFEIIHQCGEKNFKEVNNESKVMVNKDLIKYYHLFPFLEEKELSHAYSISNLIISRGGSGSIFEIAAMPKPSIIIPLPKSAQNHQTKNAYTYAENGSCMVIEETNLSPHFFLDRLKYLFSRPSELKKMEESAKKFGKPRAAEIIAYYIHDYLKS